MEPIDIDYLAIMVANYQLSFDEACVGLSLQEITCLRIQLEALAAFAI
jgi:hypothetical protein